MAAEGEQILPRRVVGKLTKWQGKAGLIETFEEIDHPAAALREGKVLLAQEDIDGLSLEPDCHVSFYVYADKSGLAALRCKPALGVLYTKVPFGVIKPVKPTGLAAARRKGSAGATGRPANDKFNKFPKAAAQAWSGGAAGAAGACGAAKGSAKGSAKGAGCSLGMWAKGGPRRPPGSTYGGGAYGSSAYGGLRGPKGSVGQAAGALSGGPNLPRQRVSEEPFAGHVVEWKGKMGWIQPDEEIDHPKAGSHKGHLYLHHKDVLEGCTLEVGQLVSFHIYEDSSGLGAEECTVL